jgi:hypothetical protein
MRKGQYSLVLLMLFTLSLFSFAQKKTSLIIAEYDENAASNHMQHLVKYTFDQGAMISKETLISVPTQKDGVKGNYVRFDIGKNQVYRDRYVITGIGNVIDLRTRKLLVAERGELIRCSGDSIIFFTNDIFKGKYFSVLDLKTEKFQKVENANFNPLPRPDVEVDETSAPFSITAYYISGKKDLLVKDAGYGEAQPLVGDDVKRKFPIFWIDNRSFLYAQFSKDQHSAQIFKVGLDKSNELIGQISEIPATAANTYFERSPDGSVIYSCGKGRFLIDLQKKKVEKLMFENLGNNFFLESDENPKYGRVIRYETVEAGKKWCLLDNAKTTNGYAAFQNDMVVGTERYPQGVAVWNNLTKKWTSLDVTSLANIIGWVEE